MEVIFTQEELNDISEYILKIQEMNKHANGLGAYITVMTEDYVALKAIGKDVAQEKLSSMSETVMTFTVPQYDMSIHVSRVNNKGKKQYTFKVIPT